MLVMRMASRIVGDWKKATIQLELLSKGDVINQTAKKVIDSNAELIVDTLKSHIDKQDLNWKPLAQSTIDAKGHDSAYYDTGELRDSLSARKLRSGKKVVRVIVGASPYKTHKASGLKLTDLLIFMEYGTKNMPARPLLRPTLKELKPRLVKQWKKSLANTIKSGKVGI